CSQLCVVLAAVADRRDIEGVEGVVLCVVVMERSFLMGRQRVREIRTAAGVFTGVDVACTRFERCKEARVLEAKSPGALPAHRVAADHDALGIDVVTPMN